MNATAYIRVSGLVQGVSYRYFAHRTAKQLGLAGFVRNRPDGDVELEVTGERGLIEELIEALRIGPPAADVTDVEVRWLPAGKGYDDFRIAF